MARSRSPSASSALSSISSRPTLDKEALSLALDQIHTSASRTDTLTTFDDFAAPPRPTSSNETKTFNAGEIVPGGLSGLYSRIKASVGAARDAVSGTTVDSADDASLKSVKPKPLVAKVSVATTAVNAESTPSSRLQSPLSAKFSDAPVTVSESSEFPGKLPPPPQERLQPGSAESLVRAPKGGDRSPDSARRKQSSGEASMSRPRPSDASLEGTILLRPADPLVPGIKLQDTRLKQVGFGVSRDGPVDPARPRNVVTSAPTSKGAPFVQMLDFRSRQDSSGPLAEVSGSFQGSGEPSATPNLLSAAGSNSRPPLLQIGASHLPGYRPSRSNSSEGDFSSVATMIAPVRRPHYEDIEEHPRPTHVDEDHISRMRSKILAKELWMRDENAKDCFYCGDTFSAFRRKHHCRICGNIFDSKCTTLVDGKMFGQSGRIRVCTGCEGIVYGTDDDSSEYSDDGSVAHQTSPRNTADWTPLVGQQNWESGAQDDHLTVGTPTMGIPVSWESKRRSAVIEFDNEPSLARPSSSRSLRSLSGHPRSSTHRRHLSRHGHQHMKSLKGLTDDRAPFQGHDMESVNKGFLLPAFHHDNIIDPDLAPFLSDDGSSEEDTPSIFATLNSDPHSPTRGETDRSGFGGLFSSVRRGKTWADRNVPIGHASGADTMSMLGRANSRHNRKRTLSVSSIYHPRPSPRRTKSKSLLNGFSSNMPASLMPTGTPKNPPLPSRGPNKMMRSASMRGASAPVVELNQASLLHVRRMLKQMLQDAQIPNSRRWEKALRPILLQCTDDVNPDIQRNDDIDVRHYIKLKKIPGGKPGDTSYVSGVVFTKNLALKSMPRSIPQPRIAIVAFPIEYTRHEQHFMSLEPVIAQEREYLWNLVKRIAALNPQVLLVEKNVAGLALDFLEQAGIAVICNVKPSVLNAVARCTQTRLITSPDKLAIDPSQLGRCGSFDVKTYVHGKMKKTFVYISGCQKDLGCTIVLRGAEMSYLRKLKRITEFMCFVVYNLKLETCVMRDEFVLIPAVLPGGTLNTERREASPALETSGSEKVQNGEGDNDEMITQESEAVKAQPVAPGAETARPAPVATPSFYNDVVEKHQTRVISSSPFVKFTQPYLLTQARELEAKLEQLKSLRDQYLSDSEDTSNSDPHHFELVEPEMVHRVVEKPSKQVRDFLFAVHNAEYEKARHHYLTQKRQWEMYLTNNASLFDPFNHQRIAVLYSMVNTRTSTPCAGPDIIALSFYNEHDLEHFFLPDIPLGQYVEDLCQGADSLCSANGCEDPMFNHHRQYVHGDGQMSVMVQSYPARIRGMQNTVLMWSCCRICQRETGPMPMSENTWKYSFGKYLELTFWSTELHPRSSECTHDIHRDHYRYFGFNNIAVRVQWDPVNLHEIIVPKPTITWKVDSDLKIKNQQYHRFKERLDRFMTSLKTRIRSINIESIAPEKQEACKAAIEELMQRANDDHTALVHNLQEKYMTSRYYEVIPMNRAARAIHENSIAWDDAFAEFEKNFFPSEKDIRRLAAIQLKKLFLERDESTSSIPTVDESLEEKDIVPETPEVSRKLSTMSPEDTHNALSTIVKEQQLSEKDGMHSSTEESTLATSKSSTATVESPIEALEHESVKHLDLAVSSEFPSPAVPEMKEVAPNLPPEPPTPQALELSPQVTKSVEQMRTSPDKAEAPETPMVESKIPRPTPELRRPGPRISPPLFRTHSQPAAGFIPRAQSSAALPTNSSTTNLNTIRPEKLSRMIADPARRMNSTGFRGGRAISQSLIPRSVAGPSSVKKDSRVSTLAKHFEQLSREFEKQRMRDREMRVERGRQARAYPLGSSKPIVSVYRDAHEAVQEPESEGQSRMESSAVTESTAETGTSTEPISTGDASSLAETPVDIEAPPEDEHEAGEPVEGEPEGEGSDADHVSVEDHDLPETTASHSPTDSSLELTLELPKHEKTSLMRMLTSFWSERSASGWAPLEYPFASNEHVWGDSDVIVREDEPSSIIALALSSNDYLEKVANFRGIDSEEESVERNLRHPKNTNIKYEFQNRGVRAQCKIFYAESFDALRRKTAVAERFVESLSRSLKWDSKGGKTKSLFLKTMDDRFVLKSLSQVEVNAFFKFAPNYFAFMHQTLFHGLPSVIAKMFGLFQVTIRNAASGTEFNWYMLVMENLFYERTPNRRFDLKGSMRNRKIHSTGDSDEVLLDENLVDLIFEKPIFVREHTMKLLRASVWNDTLFLSKQNVMDYSLMAGFDDEEMEIVVGIIDCIRTYTWDKKLETWIKDRGKNKPTVTSPKDYRNRFRIAMGKYILQAPNSWHQFQTAHIQGRPVRLRSGYEDHAPGGHGIEGERLDEE
ncbi:hypothetical protein EJ06DRAFT_489299 [Trichodelitschia bisporula]|uniref:1-phosphatidylinositol-3-phosphate 5-kinase n=1 Tax=Trichodelitschia bisporula TaxID=703511 RepID=A0A6G1I437_9PEZI|nr:hypothetical protein EJ06DRAFT_489299 [Trichodelitschia bisporula]